MGWCTDGGLSAFSLFFYWHCERQVMCSMRSEDSALKSLFAQRTTMWAAELRQVSACEHCDGGRLCLISSSRIEVADRHRLGRYHCSLSRPAGVCLPSLFAVICGHRKLALLPSCPPSTDGPLSEAAEANQTGLCFIEPGALCLTTGHHLTCLVQSLAVSEPPNAIIA